MAINGRQCNLYKNPTYWLTFINLLKFATVSIVRDICSADHDNNHSLQTIPQHRGEEAENTSSHKASERQLKKNNPFSLPQQDDCKARVDTCTSLSTKQRLQI